jgi:hypothetical protein
MSYSEPLIQQQRIHRTAIATGVSPRLRENILYRVSVRILQIVYTACISMLFHFRNSVKLLKSIGLDFLRIGIVDKRYGSVTLEQVG